MVKYGRMSFDAEQTFYEYVCDCCGRCIGGIQIMHSANHAKEIDDIAGWNFCPYCGEPLWPNNTSINLS